MRSSKNLLVVLLLQIFTNSFGQSCTGTYSSDRTLTSPRYPLNYRNNLRCNWILEKPGNYKVTVTFTYFVTESCCDKVYVYDYVNGYQRLMKRYTGRRSRFSLTSTSNKMKISLTTDYSVSYRGFSAQVTFVRQPDPLTVIPSGETHTLNSPGYPSAYGRNVQFDWLLVNEDENGILTVKVNDMNIQFNDSLQIRDGNSSESNLLGEFYGDSKPSPFLTSTRYAFISFSSDNSINTYKGFEITVTAGCSANITSYVGIIASPGYYSNQTYNNNLRCQWRFQKPLNSTEQSTNITFYVHRFQTEYQRDVLTVRNDAGIELSSISGNVSNTLFLTSPLTDNDGFTISFTSDNQNSYAGFYITFSKDCPNVDIDKGFLVGDRHYHGNTSVVCNNDYYRTTNVSTIDCLYRGNWSQPIPECKRWYMPSIESENQGFVQERTAVEIRCIGNTLQQGQPNTIQLVNSEGEIPQARFMMDSINSFKYNFDNLQRNDTGVYRCRETINGRFKYSNSISLNVTWIGVTSLSIEGSSNNVAAGSVVTMKCSSDGYPSLRYMWYKNNVIMNGSDCSTLILPAVSTDDNGYNYHCVASNGYTSSNSNQQRLNVRHLSRPTVSVNGFDSEMVPEGSDIILNCSTRDPGAILTWVDATGITVSHTPLLQMENVTKDNRGTYRCKSTKNNVDVFSHEVVVNISYIVGPVLKISPSNVIDRYSTAVLECNVDSFPPITIFTWFFQNAAVAGKSSRRLVINNVTENNIGLYSCSANFQSATYYSSSISMLVNYLNKPFLSVIPSTVVYEDDAVVLRCDSTGSGDRSYQWFKDNVIIPETTMYHVINTIKRSDSAAYHCIAMNEHGNTTSNKVAINVKYIEIPYVTKKSIDKKMELNCTSDGNPQPSYQWTHFGKTVGNESFLVLDSINDTYIATYICHVKNSAGEYTAKINANEQYLHQPKLKLLSSSIVYEGDSMLMLCETDGSKPITYQWFKDGVLVQGTSSKYSISNVNHNNHDGTYTCQASTNGQAKMSRAVTVFVYYVNAPTVSSSNLNNILQYNNVNVTCSASGNPRPTFKWYKGSRLLISSATLYIRRIHRSEAGTYVCKASTGKLMKEISIQIKVNYVNKPSVARFPTNAITEATAVTLQCVGDSNMPLFYQWYKDTTRIDDHSNKTTYSWMKILRKNSGRYSCRTVSRLGTKSSNVETVNVKYVDHPQITASMPDTKKVSEGDNITLTCDSRTNIVGVSYAWYHNGKIKITKPKLYLYNMMAADSGSYICYTSVDVVFKFAVVEVKVNYLHLPQLEILPQLTVREKSLLVLTCKTESNLPITYKILKDGVEIVKKKQQVVSSVRRNQAGSYSCVADNGMQKKSSQPSTVVVKYHDKPVIKLSKQHLTEGSEVVLSCIPSALPTATISWYRNGTLLSRDLKLTIKKITRGDTGKYECKTKNGDSEMSSSTDLMVNYIQQPTIEIVNKSKPVIGQKLHLLCKAQTNQEVSSYTWYKDDKVVSSGENATNIFMLDGVTISDSGSYKCSTASKLGSKTSEKFELRVTDHCKDAICDKNAYCVNTKDTYDCKCNDFYIWNGKTCSTMSDPQTGASKVEKQGKYYKNATSGLAVGVGILALLLLLFVIWKYKKSSTKANTDAVAKYEGFDNCNFQSGDSGI